jgi:hypothetical protein
MSLQRLALIILLCAATGFAVFGLMVWRNTDVERVGAAGAERRFAAVRDSLMTDPPILTVRGDGSLVRRPPPDPSIPVRALSTLHVMAYRGPQRGLVTVSVPFWFLRLKMPAVNFALRATDVDLGALGLTPDELSLYGPSVVVGQVRGNGDRVLVWTR